MATLGSGMVLASPASAFVDLSLDMHLETIKIQRGLEIAVDRVTQGENVSG